MSHHERKIRRVAQQSVGECNCCGDFSHRVAREVRHADIECALIRLLRTNRLLERPFFGLP